MYRSPQTHALIKVASKATRGTYDPDVLAHELGHSSIHGTNPYLMPVRNAAPVVGAVLNIAADTPVGLMGHLLPLADEADASRRAVRTMREWDLDKEDVQAAKKRLGLGLASYAVGPAVDAGLTVGGIAAGSRFMRAAAPFAGKIVADATGPSFSRAMDSVPIKGLSEDRAKSLAAKTNPKVKVHFSKKALPERGVFISRPTKWSSNEDSKTRKELGAFIGDRASGKLLREGGVLVGPTN